MSPSTVKKRKRSGTPRAFRKITRSSGKIEMIDGRHDVPGGSRFLEWVKRKKWDLEVWRNDVWGRLDAALDEFGGLDGLVARRDKEAIRGLALEFRQMGTRYNFGVAKTIKHLYEAERFLGGCREEMEGFVDSSFNSVDNIPLKPPNEWDLLGRVSGGVMPGATISIDYEGSAKEEGLLVLRDHPNIHVSRTTPFGEVYSAEFVLDTFSGLHPLVKESLETTYEAVKRYPVAELLKDHKVLDKTGKVAHVVIKILEGLSYGYPLRKIYEFVHRRIFYPTNRGNLEPRVVYIGEVEEYRGLNFKRYLGPKITS